MAPKSFITRVIAFGVGFVGALLALELALRALPVIDGIYAADPRASWPIHTIIPGSKYTSSSGWNFQNVHRGSVNNYGYVSPFDYLPGSGGIAVIGDSYIESTMNDYGDTLQGALAGELRTPRNIMNFGMAGAEMPHYLGTAEIVAREFQPDWAVFLITLGDFTRGFAADPGYFHWHDGGDSPIALAPELNRSALTKFVRSLALVRYLRGNLALAPSQLVQWKRGVEASRECRPGVLSKKDEALLDAFADRLPKALGLPPDRVILVFDSDRKAVYAGKSEAEALRCAPRAAVANQRLAQLARDRGMHVIDSYPVFQDYYRRHRLPLDRAPLDPHWNPTAHRLMAGEVARIIEP